MQWREGGGGVARLGCWREHDYVYMRLTNCVGLARLAFCLFFPLEQHLQRDMIIISP